jgi:hypothetical protein
MFCSDGFLRQIFLLALIALGVNSLLFQREVFASQLRLTWTDNSDNEDGFEIQRRSADAGFVAVAVVATNTTAYADPNLAAGVTYCYRVRAFNSETISDFSNLGCAMAPAMLSVAKSGSGAGSIVSNPPGIDCGSDCSEPYSSGTIVTLLTTPAEGSVFTGWSGTACVGTGECIFNLASDRWVNATFDSITPENSPLPPAPGPAPLLLTGLNVDLVSPRFVGTPITFTAAASGGVAPLQFKWWMFDGAVWRVAMDWESSGSFIFNPATHGVYVIAVWARSSILNGDWPENSAVLTQPFTMMPRACPAGQYLAEFFNNRSLSGSPASTTCDHNIGYSWLPGGVGFGIGAENFSVRWTGLFPLNRGVYDFVATADDGIRAWIDGNLIIDGWYDQSATTYQATLDIGAGEHLVQVDYYQNLGDALTHFYWQKVIASDDDFYVTLENNRLSVEAPGILTNDTIVGGNSLSATLVSTTASGALVLHPDGSFSYTPNNHFTGIDNFTYRADNGLVAGNLATVTIAVTPVNDIPLTSNDAYVVMENSVLLVDAPGILANDNDLNGDSLTAVLVSTTANGVLQFNSDGSFSYTPNGDFTGTDTFTYLASDGVNHSNLAMVILTVSPANDIPVAHNDTYETMAGIALSAAAPGVLANDTDVDNNPLMAMLVTEPLFGTVTLNADGSFVYLPLLGFTGTDSFTYKATDGSAHSNLAMVTISVSPANAP